MITMELPISAGGGVLHCPPHVVGGGLGHHAADPGGHHGGGGPPPSHHHQQHTQHHQARGPDVKSRIKHIFKYLKYHMIQINWDNVSFTI